MCIRDSLEFVHRHARPRVVVDLEALRHALVADGEPRLVGACLLYTSDAADERSSVDLGGRRIIKNKNNILPTRLRIAEKPTNEHKVT